MSISLVGLIFFQFYWIRNVHQLTEERFEDKIHLALRETISDIEMGEALQLINPNEYYQDIVMNEFGDVMQAQESIQVRDTMIFENGEPFRFLVVTGTTIDTATGLQTEHKVLTKDLGQITATEIDNSLIGINDSNEFAIHLHKSFERQIMNKAKYLNEMMMRMFSTNLFDDLALRLNIQMLDSIIYENLSEFDLNTDFKFNVIDKNTNEVVKFSSEPEHLDTNLIASSYNAKLYPNDNSTSDFQLLLSFPEQAIYLWTEMTGTLIGSVLLILIILLAFYFAVSTIFKQKQLSEIKNDFISNMTHELKTPISTISLACEAVRDPDVGKDQESVKGFVSIIEQENKRLGKLVENVLQTALIDKGKLKLNLQKLPIHSLVKDVVDAFQIRFKDKGGKIRIERLDDIFSSVDKIHFGNILYNLLDNSLKYCSISPEVEVKLIKNDGGFNLEVKDNGIGINKEDQKRIFDKLFRVSTGDVHDVKGFGLGLSYVYSIVKLHNGDINLISDPGKGSTFKISI